MPESCGGLEDADRVGGGGWKWWRTEKGLVKWLKTAAIENRES